MANFTVIYDANVLYPAPLRSLLVYLATTGLFRARWTEEIHHEWIRNLLIKRPDLSVAQLNSVKEQMNLAVPDSLVTGYQRITAGLTLPDPDDRHVLAAALKANAELIITANLKDFPDAALKEFNISAQHPDEFILDLLDLNQEAVLNCLKAARTHYRNPQLSVSDYLDCLQRQGLVKTTEYLSPYSKRL
ncbi:PIN domain-containing protein [Thalassolituus oleivorans]|uniref:PIN domain-containing protein n=1 Tax=Thalassolituus oleivorans TaxID=187493 RepID=UPI0023F18834|nr:PIN domain-containing protein [Thalassolituus oleivorans]